jgi:gamma-glutamyltranspeptidase/glutathione hydrolase
MERFFKANGGLLTAKDLAAFEPQWTEPLHTTYREHDIYSNPATSRGGFEVLMQANLIRGFDLQASGPGSAATLHAVIESIKLAKSDIYRYVADPKFARIPVEGMLSRDYAQQRRKLIDPGKAMAYPDPGVPPGFEEALPPQVAPKVPGESYGGEQHTTSFSIVDRFGNAVGCTPTLGGLFGSSVVVGSTGLLLNNGMRHGNTSPYPGHVNHVGPGKVPLLNNAPVLVLKEGKVAFVFGTPGGETIGQTQFQVLINLIDFGMPVQEAIEAPRLALGAAPNFYKPGAEIKVSIEGRVPKETIAALENMGHQVTVLPGWGSLGHMQTIRVDPKTGFLTAGGDPRRTGYAIGY